jgi:hypothetical protein
MRSHEYPRPSGLDVLGVAGADDQLPLFVSRPVDLRNRVEWRAFIVDARRTIPEAD